MEQISASNLSPIRIAIIGGGIAGTTLAISLLRYKTNLSVTVYESTASFGEIGAGLGLSPNAHSVLRLLGSDTKSAYDRVVDLPIREEDKDVNLRYVFGFGKHQGQEYAYKGVRGGFSCVHRARFLEELVKIVPPNVAQFKKRLDRVSESNDGDGLTMHFADGTYETADVILGADGIHSVIRPLILSREDPAQSPQFTGSVGYRALVPLEIAKEQLGESCLSPRMICGKDALINTYPVDQGRFLNVVVVDMSFQGHKWNGPWTYEADSVYLREKFQDWDVSTQTLVALINKPGLMAWTLWDLPPAKTFYKGRMAILGDAAHSSTPFQGQGANMALEDAWILGEALSEVKDVGELEMALKAYDQLRRTRAQRVVKSSREAGELFALRLKGVLDDPDKMRENIYGRYDWMWYHDIEGDGILVKDVFRKLVMR